MNIEGNGGQLHTRYGAVSNPLHGAWLAGCL